MVTAFRGPAMTFWFFECAGQPAEPEIIATKLEERYRPYMYEYGLHAQMQSLHMQLTSWNESRPLDVYVPEWPYRGLQTACAFAWYNLIRGSSGNMSPLRSGGPDVSAHQPISVGVR